MGGENCRSLGVTPARIVMAKEVTNGVFLWALGERCKQGDLRQFMRHTGGPIE